jgi:hypothetical protein
MRRCGEPALAAQQGNPADSLHSRLIFDVRSPDVVFVIQQVCYHAGHVSQLRNNR